jgi:hypothetical protein
MKEAAVPPTRKQPMAIVTSPERTAQSVAFPVMRMVYSESSKKDIEIYQYKMFF